MYVYDLREYGRELELFTEVTVFWSIFTQVFLLFGIMDGYGLGQRLGDEPEEPDKVVCFDALSLCSITRSFAAIWFPVAWSKASKRREVAWPAAVEKRTRPRSTTPSNQATKSTYIDSIYLA